MKHVFFPYPCLRVPLRRVAAFLLTMAACGAAWAYDCEVDISQNPPSLSGSISGCTDVTSSPGLLTITSNGNIRIYRGTTATPSTNQILVNNGATPDITLDNVHIDVSTMTGVATAFRITGNSTVNLTLAGDNALKSRDGCAGLEVASGNEVTIGGANLNDTDTLVATGGNASAGIGGASPPLSDGGTITITGGTITATGGSTGAGIGGGTGMGIGGIGNGGTITISGGTVTATAGDNGAGIGGGGAFGMGSSGGNGGTVTISGGTVTATGSAGIGGGSGSNGGNGGTVIISGGTVKATSVGPGAGIGPGNTTGSNGTVTITGGSIDARSAGGERVKPRPTNGTVDVFLNTLTVQPSAPKALVTGLSIAGTPSSYGLDDVYTDGNSRLYFWLPASGGQDEDIEATLKGNAYYGEAYERVDGDGNQQTLYGPPAPAASIPALDPWALALLGGALGLAAARPLRRRVR